MSESQLSEECTKCGLNFLSLGIEINFCPKCGCERIKLEPAADKVGEPTLNDHATNGFTSSGNESTAIADTPDASHTDQEEVCDPTTEKFSDADDPLTEQEGIGPAPLIELAKNGAVSPIKELDQRRTKEAEKLMGNERDIVPEPKIIHSESDCTSAQTHEAGQVEERPIPEDRISEGITSSPVASSFNNQVS
jgi:predicted  nucleic acid-binding Zn-ribbon protein